MFVSTPLLCRAVFLWGNIEHRWYWRSFYLLAVTVTLHSCPPLCLVNVCTCLSCCLCYSTTRSCYLLARPLCSLFGFYHLKVHHISTHRNPQQDTNRQLGAITDIAVCRLTIWKVSLGYPIRNVSLLGHTLCAGVRNAVMGTCLFLPDRCLGLYIRGVEEESRSRKEGLFQEDECIVKINKSDLMDKTFSQWVQHRLCVWVFDA